MIQEYIGLIFAVIVVAAVIIFQIRSFLKTKGKIKELDSLFEDVDTLSLKRNVYYTKCIKEQRISTEIFCKAFHHAIMMKTVMKQRLYRFITYRFSRWK